jgi:hypothetical protein
MKVAGYASVLHRAIINPMYRQLVLPTSVNNLFRRTWSNISDEVATAHQKA